MKNEDFDLMDLKLELQKSKEPLLVRIKKSLSFFKKNNNNEIIFDDCGSSEPIVKTTNLEEIKEKIKNYSYIEEKPEIEIDFKLTEKPRQNFFKEFINWFNSYLFSTFEKDKRKFKIRNRILALLLFISIFLLFFLNINPKEKEVLNKVVDLEKKYENIIEKTKNFKIEEKIIIEKEKPKKELNKIIENKSLISEKSKIEVVEEQIDIKEIEKIVNKKEEEEEEEIKIVIEDTKETLINEEKSVFPDKEELKKRDNNVKNLFNSIKTKKEQNGKDNNYYNDGYYAIQLAVVKYPERMEKEFEVLKNLKLNYTLEKLITKNNDTLYRIYIGKYKTKDLALKDSEMINKKLNVKSFVKKRN